MNDGCWSINKNVISCNVTQSAIWDREVLCTSVVAAAVFAELVLAPSNPDPPEDHCRSAERGGCRPRGAAPGGRRAPQEPGRRRGPLARSPALERRQTPDGRGGAPGRRGPRRPGGTQGRSTRPG